MKQGELGSISHFHPLEILIFFFSFPFFFSHMVPYNQPEAAVVCFLSFFAFPPNLLLLLFPFLFLVYVYCFVYCCDKRLLFSSNHPVHIFNLSLLANVFFFAGFNHSVDYGSPFAAWAESGCVTNDGLIPLLLFLITRRHCTNFVSNKYGLAKLSVTALYCLVANVAHFPKHKASHLNRAMLLFGKRKIASHKSPSFPNFLGH